MRQNNQIKIRLNGELLGILLFHLIAFLLFSPCTFLPLSAQNALTLQQLKDSALQHNIAIRNAQLNIEAACQQRSEAFTKFFPNISGTGLTFNANRGMAKMEVNPGEVIPQSLGEALATMLPAEALASMASPISISMMKNGTIGSLMAVQPIFAGGQIVNGNRLARIGEEASRLQLSLSENEVEKQTTYYYWQFISLQQKMHTIDAVDSLLSSIHKDVDMAVKAGVAMPNDLLQIELRRNDIESQRLKLKNATSIVRMMLAHHCGLRDTSFAIDHSSFVHLADELTIEQCDVQGLPEYQLLNKQVEAARLQQKMEVGKNLPTVSVGAGYTYHNLMENDHNFGLLFATVNVPISDWWGGTHAIKRRKIEYQKAQEQLADNTELLKIRMQKALNDVVEALGQLQIASRSVEQASENLRISQNRYKAGTCTMSDLLQTHLLYQQTLDQQTDCYCDYQNKLLEYHQATGQ